MRQLKLNFARVKMSMISTIARLGLLLCILGCVTARQDSGSRNCQPNEGYCQMHSDCCSGKCMTYLYKCARRVDMPYPVPYPPNQIYDVVKGPVKPVKGINEHVQIVGLPSESDPSADVYDFKPRAGFGPIEGSAAECGNVGDPCSRAEECCNLRCHTYMHRCVT
ncbi:uncharacterized protein LOC128251994 [Drosophila gunungcola]|uniref:uncharacterized protein LOC128251994 n=1 Tax=Drosophila gunungcola TaxID=103775 RepID=UPI0022DEEAEE|nr:uncharacterized protein LOC128251994 [Drosophila gunungcola]